MSKYGSIYVLSILKILSTAYNALKNKNINEETFKNALEAYKFVTETHLGSIQYLLSDICCKEQGLVFKEEINQLKSLLFVLNGDCDSVNSALSNYYDNNDDHNTYNVKFSTETLH